MADVPAERPIVPEIVGPETDALVRREAEIGFLDEAGRLTDWRESIRLPFGTVTFVFYNGDGVTVAGARDVESVEFRRRGSHEQISLRMGAHVPVPEDGRGTLVASDVEAWTAAQAFSSLMAERRRQ